MKILSNLLKTSRMARLIVNYWWLFSKLQNPFTTEETFDCNHRTNKFMIFVQLSLKIKERWESILFFSSDLFLGKAPGIFSSILQKICLGKEKKLVLTELKKKIKMLWITQTKNVYATIKVSLWNCIQEEILQHKT